MDREKIVKLSNHLYESSVLMMDIDKNVANDLLEMSSSVLSLIEPKISHDDLLRIRDLELELTSEQYISNRTKCNEEL